jgi:hypothetical protein
MIDTYGRRDPFVVRSLFVAILGAAVAMLLGRFVAGGDDATVRGTVTISVLIGLSLILFWAIARNDTDGRLLYMFLMGSLLAKLGALYFRFYIRLLADAFQYHNTGREIAQVLAGGQWPSDLVSFTGTRFIRLLVGLFYFAFGETFYGAAMTWAWCGLIGMLFFHKAFVTAFPNGDRRLYMILIFFYPSMLLWTSSLGKDALVVMFLGMATFGYARLNRGMEPIGLFWAAVGVIGAMSIRPHVTAALVAGMTAGFLTRPINAGLFSPAIRLFGILAIGAVAVLVVGRAGEYVGLESVEVESIVGFIEEQQEHTEQGGAAFQQVDITSPLGLALAVPTVLFRPFPWEAHNANALVSSLEGLGLLVLMIYRWKSVKSALTGVRRNSFFLFLLVYAAIFIFLFSAIGNFGIIARQRVQLFPFVFMWIACLPKTAPVGRETRTRG